VEGVVMKMMFPEQRLSRSLGGWANDVNSLVDSLLGAAKESGLQGSTSFSPRMDIHEADDKYVLSLDLPGMKLEDVHIELENDQLVVHGTRQSISDKQGERYHRIERVFGEFRRSVKLPRGINRDRVEAEYADGVLSVSLPKSKENAARKIEVRRQTTVNPQASQADAPSEPASQEQDA
jgi:HSP20 family protein